MNRITEGSICTAVRQRTGTGSNGDWELLLTADEKGNNQIALFASNKPSGVTEGGKFRIERIHSISLGNRKGSDDAWHPSVSINADVVPVENLEEFRKDGDLPF